MQKLTVQDMREIAHFHKVILNYLKMKRIEKMHSPDDPATAK